MYKRSIFLAISVFFFFTGAFAQFMPDPLGIKLVRTLQLTNNLYVDEVDSEKLTEAAIRAMLRELDPHSSYLNKDEVRAMNEPLQGDFEGIGISFNMVTDTLYVIEVIWRPCTKSGYYARR